MHGSTAAWHGPGCAHGYGALGKCSLDRAEFVHCCRLFRLEVVQAAGHLRLALSATADLLELATVSAAPARRCCAVGCRSGLRPMGHRHGGHQPGRTRLPQPGVRARHRQRPDVPQVAALSHATTGEPSGVGSDELSDNALNCRWSRARPSLRGAFMMGSGRRSGGRHQQATTAKAQSYTRHGPVVTGHPARPEPLHPR